MTEAHTGRVAVRYPSYMSLDKMIDTERIRSLDAYLTQRIKRHIAEDLDDYLVKEHDLESTAPYKPGVRESWLQRTLPGTPYDYLDLNLTTLWRRTEAGPMSSRS